MSASRYWRILNVLLRFVCVRTTMGHAYGIPQIFRQTQVAALVICGRSSLADGNFSCVKDD